MENEKYYVKTIWYYDEVSNDIKKSIIKIYLKEIQKHFFLYVLSTKKHILYIIDRIFMGKIKHIIFHLLLLTMFSIIKK